MTTESGYKQRTSQNLDFEESELRSTMHEFLSSEKEPKKSLYNLATLTGGGLIILSFLAALSILGLPMNPFVNSLLGLAPFIGGILIALVGFGFLMGESKKKKIDKAVLSEESSRRASPKASSFKSSAYTNDIPGADSRSEPGIRNDLDDFERFAPGYSSTSRTRPIDPYGYRPKKGLMKSRFDKKIAGVCGGIANYFGISSGFVRLMFIIGAFATTGGAIFLYLILSIFLKKEPAGTTSEF